MSAKLFDATLKDLMDACSTDWATELGPWQGQRVEVIDADLATVTAASDKVLRLHSDAFTWLLHLEANSGSESDLPERLSWYNALLGHRHRLPVRSVVLLLRREANASNLTGVYERRFPDEDAAYVTFRYRVVRLWELPLERLLTGRLGMLPLAPLTDEAAAVLPAVIGRIDERLRQEASPEEADKLRAATFVLMGLRYSDELSERLFRGITTMEDSVTYQAIIRKGAARGRVEEAKKFLLILGRSRFGSPDAPTTAALEAINDLDRLEALGQRLLHVSTWQELLAPPSAG